MKRSITFRTGLNIDWCADMLEVSKTELINFLMTSQYSFSEVALLADALENYENYHGTSHMCAWFYYEGKSYDLGELPHLYWIDSSYDGVARIDSVLKRIKAHIDVIVLMKERRKK